MTDWDDPEVKQFLDQFEENALPKIRGSAVVLSLHSSDPDPKMCLEVGAAILFDKPLLVCVRPGAVVPQNLRRAGAHIVEIEEGQLTDLTKERIQAALESIIEDDPRVRKTVH
jgi:hypothetical protein